MGLPLSTRAIVLPVGISFFTFMAISYVVDTYRGDFEPVTFPKFAAYLSFFPHLVAGPIVRPGELIPQMETPRDPRRVDTSRAFYLIATGPLQEGRDRELPRDAHHATRCSPSRERTRRRRSSSRPTPTRCRSTPTSPATPTWRSGSRCCSASRFPQNFDSPYAAISLQRLLAPLAHDALALAPRLPVHPARRQPERARPDVRQPDGDDAARRALARRLVDVRRLGRDPRDRARVRALRAATGPGSSRRRRAARASGCGGSSRSTSSASPGSSSAPTRCTQAWEMITRALHALGPALAARHGRRPRVDRRRDRQPVPAVAHPAAHDGALLAAAVCSGRPSCSAPR